MDVCTLVDDTVALASLLVCILRMLYRLRRANQRWRQYAVMLISENRWRAQRYGLDEGLVDFGKGAVVPCADLIDELIDLVAEDADALGCTKELLHLRDIVADGTSAHRQIRCYDAAIAGGADTEAALAAIVDQLIAETRDTSGLHG